MADVLPSSQRNNVGQLKLSTTGAAVAGPPSTNRAKLTTTARNALSSLKASTNRAKRLYLEDIPHRIKCYIVSARDDTDIGRSHRPHQQHSINHGPNNGLRYDKAISSRGASTGHYTFGAWQDFKSPVLESPFTLSVTPPLPALKALHLGHRSVIKTKEPTPRQLLASKYFKELPTFLTEIPRGTADGNITVRRPEKKGESLSHESAIPIPLNDVLLRSPIPTNSRATCCKRDGPDLEGLIDVEDIDITPLRLWDDADSQVAVDVDGKDVSSKSPVPENILVPKVPSFKLLESIPECPDETHEQCGSSTTTPPASERPERGTSRNTGGGILSMSGRGGTPSFEGQTPSPSIGKNSLKRGQNALAVNSTKDSSPERFPPRSLRCWYDAMGYPCCNGKGHTSPEVRRLLSDHFRSNKSPNHHVLFEECQLCGRLFADESSWEEHQKLLKSASPCKELSASDLKTENYGMNKRGISPTHMKKVDEAMEQYKKNRTIPSECGKDQHDAWIHANYKLYIGNSSTTEGAAKYELGKWLVAWCAVFPGAKIPYNPFTKDYMGSLMQQEILGLIQDDLIEQSMIGNLPLLDPGQYSIIAQICGKALEQSQLQQLETEESPKSKRRRIRAAETSSQAQLLPPDSFRHDPTPYLMTMSPYTPSPSSFVDSAITDPSSYNDAPCIDPKMIDNEGQTDGREPDPLALLSVGAHLNGQNFSQAYHGAQYGDQNIPKNGSINSATTIPGGTGSIWEWNQNNPHYGGH